MEDTLITVSNAASDVFKLLGVETADQELFTQVYERLLNLFNSGYMDGREYERKNPVV